MEERNTHFISSFFVFIYALRKEIQGILFHIAKCLLVAFDSVYGVT